MSLAAVAAVPVVSLQLVDPYYYHLDTCLLVLDVSELRRAGGGPKCCTLEVRGSRR